MSKNFKAFGGPKRSSSHNFNRFRGKRNRGGGSSRNQPKPLDVRLLVNNAKEVTETAYVPHNSFEDFNLATPLKSNILGRGFSHPTPIQDRAISPILEGRDFVGLAHTGTGKTAAFLIPIINTIFQDRDKKALIIAPTRELATQINAEFRSLSAGMKIYSATTIGGTNLDRQVQDLRRNPHIVIGTPGRLKDLIQRKVLHLEQFSIFVLDEVDLMVDIGFITEIKYFVSLLPQNRQSLFFSATIPEKISKTLYTFVKNPITVSIKSQDTSENVHQDVIKVVDRTKKIEQLHDLLIQQGFDKVLIFGRTKHGVEKLSKELSHRGFKAGAIHGNKSQGQRQRVLDNFKQNHIRILLATDVASRGLDIDNVTHVINYDMPATYEDYIHRVGRTGRANRRGIALTFVE